MVKPGKSASDIISYYPAHKMKEPNLLSPNIFDLRIRNHIGGQFVTNERPKEALELQ